MATVRVYRRYSARCFQEARTTDDPQQRSFLVEMAQAWRRLAEQAMNFKGAQISAVSEPDRGD